MERLKCGKGHVMWRPTRPAGLYKGHSLSAYTMWVKRTQRDYLEKGSWQRQTQEEMKERFLPCFLLDQRNMRKKLWEEDR